jgi:hypothetical protein
MTPVRICQSLTDRRRWRREPWVEEPRPPAESPRDGCDKDPDGGPAGGTQSAPPESGVVEAAVAAAEAEAV